ncbi:hypothetical protein CRM22_001125 [Opisthorchis felineus]|uniref:Mitogen-activated protein kinase kinase kinase 1 n=1 Tax=Opisthorchis felineus TaxID=147828 RepID=A0A4S2MBZ7_OPIFE|nr:hypothetical protein CRM22_001125 [Opisthorchis felineus]
MYVRVTSPTKDSTIRVQFNFKQSPASCELTGELKPFATEQSIKQALTRSFVLVCQPAPNAFVLVSRTTQACRNNAQHTGDERVDPTQLGSVRRRPRFHVVIGPQLCNCQDYLPADDSSPRRPTESVPRVVPPANQPCVHVLFVMLRILKISADDPCLLNVPLPTSKAESLIHQYQSSKLTRRCEIPKGHKCSLISLSDVDPKSATTCAVKETQTFLPLAMPKAIYPHRSGINSPRTPQLLALLNEKVQNSPECQELSTLTKDIKAVSRLDTESAGATIDSGSTNPTSTTMSRTSSSDSVEGSRLQAASAYKLEESGDGSAQRRPQTAPQSDPPPKTMRGRTVSMRHACSTTFRPIGDLSPDEDRRLSPIKSGDISAHSCLRFRSEIKQHPYETLRQMQRVQSTSSSGMSPQQTPIFRHVVHSPFKPVIRPSPSTLTENSQRVPKGQEYVKSSTEEDSIQLSTESGMQVEPCVLCLETLEGDRSQDNNLLRCRSADAPQRCLATFHLTCCQIWLEEITLEGDSPHCPACLSRWDATPFTIENPQDCAVTSVHSTEPSPSSHCCLCCTQSQDPLRKPVEEENTVTAKHPVSDETTTISPTNELTSQCTSTTTLNSKGPTIKEAAAHPSQSGPPVTPNCPPYLDYKNCVAAFSLEVADAIAAQNSVTRRQWALQRAAQLTVRRILVARQQHQQSKLKVSEASRDHEDQLGSERRAQAHSTTPPSVPTEPDCLRVMFRLIQHLFDDPADAIFIDALRAFRELLGYLVCFNVETQTALQRAIAPILRRLLRFVGGASVLWTLRSPTSGLPTPILMHQTSTSSVESWNVSTPPMPDGRSAEKVDVLSRLDSKETDRSVMGTGVLPPPAANLRDRANLALATLVELAKGQNGALAIGRDVECAVQCLPVCGLQHLTRFVLSSAKFHATHLIGRLTLLDKLIRMDQTLPSLNHSGSGTEPHSVTATLLPEQLPSILISNPDRLARRHLCSSLVFARRHLLPPTPNAEMAICFPHHYQYQTGANSNPVSCASPVNSTGKTSELVCSQTQQNNPALDSLYNTQLKASRVARRVFLTAARSLLTYGNRTPPESTSTSNVHSAQTPYSSDDFCPREFVEVEINRTEAPLAAWIRNKLAPLLYPNLVVGPEPSLIPVRMTLSEAPSIPPRNSQVLKKNTAKLPTSKTIETMSCMTVRHCKNISSKSRSSSPAFNQKTSSVTILLDQPPTPPPRRKISIVQENEFANERQSKSEHPHFFRVALEPAYDLVPLSESENYSSTSECEEDDVDRQQEEFPDCMNEPTYGGRSLGSEAELRTEQNAVLRSALRRCSRSLRPLLPVPALSMVMDAFRSTKKLPSADEYYESIDWIRGPILGHGAFSHCYQARDTRTGLLMAVKRIRLGGGSVFPVPTDKSKANKVPGSEGLVNGANPDGPLKGENPRLQKTSGVLSAEAAAQLSEVQAEVDIMIRLSHPNVLRLFGVVFCAHRNLVDLFIEWMPGGSITSLLRQYGAFNESLTLAYGVQVVRGLAYLHKHGILHRDLKGANLLVDHTGSVVRISDFGASARLIGDKSVAGQFQGQVIGTFSFMAPEVLRGETYGRACDIWSVGCCLIEMLTSKPPWYDAKLTNRYALMFAIATSESPPTYPPNIDEAIVDILDACFARHAPSRPTASRLLSYRAFARLTESFSPSKSSDDPRSVPSSFRKGTVTTETGFSPVNSNSDRKSRSKSSHTALPPLPRSASICPNALTRVA